MARRIGNRRAEASLFGNYAFMALRLGAWDELLAEVRGLPASVADSPVLLGNVMQVLAFRGEPVERAVLAASLAELDPAVQEAILLDVDMNLALVTGRPADAIAAATRLAEVSSASAPAAFVVATHAASLERRPGGAATRGGRAGGNARPGHRARRGPARDPGRHRRPGRAPRRELGGLPGSPRPPRRPRPSADPGASSGSASRRPSATGRPDTALMVNEVRAVITELRALALADRLDEALARHGPPEQAEALDRDPDHAAPLHPRAVVAPDAAEPGELSATATPLSVLRPGPAREGRVRDSSQPTWFVPSRRANSASCSRHEASSRRAWRTIQGSTRGVSSRVSVGPYGPSSRTIPDAFR